MPALTPRCAGQPKHRGRLARRAVLVLCVALGGFSVAATAHGAIYGVDVCQHPGGSAAPADGWTTGVSGARLFASYGCAGDGGLDTGWPAGDGQNYGDAASWTVFAPPNTSLAALSASRSSFAGPSQAYGSPVAQTYTNKGVIDACTQFQGCRGQNGPVYYGLDNAQYFAFGVVCGGGPGGRCPAGEGTYHSFYGIRLFINDDNAPTFNGSPSGTLLSPTTTARARTLNYSASDLGGGILRHRLLADGGREVRNSIVDANGGKCARFGGNGNFSHLVPCRNTASGSVNYDTGELADGTHELTLEVSDVTETNRTRFGPWPVLVDNQPPAMSGPTTLTGIAQVNRQLSCVAPAINGQGPTVSYAWARFNADGSGRAVIDGAEGSRYTLMAADLGKKITCTVTARDAGGTSSRESALTSGPFEGGAIVQAGTGPQPTGTTTMTTSGASLSQPQTGDRLEINPPEFPAGTSVRFAWLRCDATGQNCTAIPGATGSSYTLVATDKDRRIVGQVTATDASGTTVLRSEPTGVVRPASSTTTPPKTDSSAGGGSGGTAVAPGVTLAEGAPNGENACSDAVLTTRFVSGSRTTVKFGRGATLRGKLTCKGQPVRGAALELTSRTLGTTTYQAAGAITTDNNGQFTRVLRKGPGRQLRLTYTAFGGDKAVAAQKDAMMFVRGRVRLKRVVSRVRAGGRITFRGKLYGGGIPRGFKLNLEAQEGNNWRLIESIAVKRNGTFRTVYRCKCAVPNTRFKFRVKIPSATRLPYLPATSRAWRIRVR